MTKHVSSVRRSISRAWLALAAAMIAGAVAKADPGDHDETREIEPVASAAPAVEPSPALVEPEPDQPGRTPPIEDPSALASFFDALERTAAGEGITRVTHLGDSSIGMDALPHGLRRRYQAELGDAGPGFIVLQDPTHHYASRTVRLRIRAPWDACAFIHRCRRDGHYGLGGVTVQARRGASTRILPRPGRRVSRAELWYLAQPGGGRIELRFGDVRREIDTGAPALEDRWEVIEEEPGEHEVLVTARGGGSVRAYGVVLENDGPGVVWDSLSMRGAFTPRLLQQDEAHFADQLARRDPDLVVLNYGGNDLLRIANGDIDRDDLAEETHRVLARVRAAVPDASCLVVGIGDHLRSGSANVGPRQVELVLAAQRDAAARDGCAFWDTTAAMGGTRSYARWRRAGLASDDGRHLAERGRRVIAARLHAALEHARAVARTEPR